MSTSVPLTIDTKKELTQLKQELKTVFSEPNSDLAQSVPIPDEVHQEKALPSGRGKSSTDSVLLCRHDMPFLTVILRWDPTEGVTYSMLPYAGWTNHGTDSQMMAYWRAVDTALEHLGVLAETYRFTCPCGDEQTMSGGCTEVAKRIGNHNDSAAHSGHTSATVLIEQGVELTSSPA